MNIKKNMLVMTLFLVFAIILMSNEVESYHVQSPNCNYLLVGPSNVSDVGDTQNTTFKAVIQTTSNQTSSQTFVRLLNQNGATVFTNQTGRMINTTGETASYEATWATPLDAQKYSLSAGFFFLNNTFYNYSITQANCVNRTFTVSPISGGYAVIQEQAGAVAEQKKDSTMLLIAAIVVVILIVAISQTKNKR